MGECDTVVYPYAKVVRTAHSSVVTLCGHVPPGDSSIVYLNQDYYLLRSDGRIGTFDRSAETKGDGLREVRRSFSRLKSLINANYDSPSQVRFLTLTYAENMTDNSRIVDDWRQFIKRVRKIWAPSRYIYVKEQQGRGAWHLHVILFFDGEAPYMDNAEVAACWGQGFVNVKGFPDDINNLGNYLCAYLTDDEKASKKGARLCNYPKHVRLYNCSRNVRRPDEYALGWSGFLDEFGACEPMSAYDRVVTLEDGSVRTFRYLLYIHDV